jgi:hypothetical protein
MSWAELKELVKDHAPTLTFARTFDYRNNFCGMLEFEDREDAEAVVRELDNRRIEGSQGRLRVCYGDLSMEQGGKGRSFRDDDRSGRRDDRDGSRHYDDRYRGDYDRGDRGDRGYDDRRRYDRSPPRQYERRDEQRDDGEPIMTLFVMDLPDDARDGEVMDDLEPLGAQRAIIMHKGSETHSFVRFGTVSDAERAMGDINYGKVKVCQQKVRADMARRNTSV